VITIEEANAGAARRMEPVVGDHPSTTRRRAGDAARMPA
jgi:hypothetical protein